MLGKTLTMLPILGKGMGSGILVRYGTSTGESKNFSSVTLLVVDRH